MQSNLINSLIDQTLEFIWPTEEIRGLDSIPTDLEKERAQINTATIVTTIALTLFGMIAGNPLIAFVNLATGAVVYHDLNKLFDRQTELLNEGSFEIIDIARDTLLLKHVFKVITYFHNT